MKILHASYLFADEPGIRNQLIGEYNAEKPKGLVWDTKLYCSLASIKHEIIEQINDGAPNSITSFKARRCFFEKLQKKINGYDIILLRHDSSSPFQLLFLIKNRGKPIFLVHHSKEIDELKISQGFRKYIKIFFEHYFGRMCIKLAHGTVGVTNEIANYQLTRTNLVNRRKGLIYPNGIHLSKEQKILDLRESIPEFIFVSSSFSPWQGLDILVRVLRKSQKKFFLHIIGRIDVESDIFEVIENDLRFIVHEMLDKDEIAQISYRCWIGISSLALYRQCLEEACALKVREYLSLGLPVYGGYTETLPQDFPYYKKGDVTEESLFEYASFARNLSKSAVRSASEKYISKSKMISGLVMQLNSP